MLDWAGPSDLGFLDGVLAPLFLWTLSILSSFSLYGSFSDLVAVLPWCGRRRGCSGVGVCVCVCGCVIVRVRVSGVGKTVAEPLFGDQGGGSEASGGLVPRVGSGAQRRRVPQVCVFVCLCECV